MPEHNYQITTVRLPDRTIDLNRINIFLGANGTGKSKLLQEIRGNAGQFGNKPVIYVEGGRTVKMVNSLELDGNTYGRFSNIENAKNEQRNRHTNLLADRVKDDLLLIDRLGQDNEIKHSRAVTAWIVGGQTGPCPAIADAPLQRLLGLFMEVFPAITLTYDNNSKKLTCTKKGSSYSPTEMSDGERQVFSILADIVILGGDDRLIIVDEPELNLNPGLANRLWDLVENELPKSVFLYATHSVSFATRDSVEKILVLSNDDEAITEIANVKELEPTELPVLLGNIPTILSSAKALAVEGKESSFDAIFYRWLLDSKDTELVPVGDSEEVKAVANKTGVWKALAPRVKIKGIIDRDFKEYETAAEAGGSNNYLVLEYHEAESYLCHPQIVTRVARGIGSVEQIPTEEEITEFIITRFKEETRQIIARRVMAKATIRLAVAVDRQTLSTIKTDEELTNVLVAAAEKETDKVSEVGPEKIKELISTESKACQTAIDNRDIEFMLCLMPGKSLLKALAPVAGCNSPHSFARAAQRHINISEHPKLQSLKEKLNAW